MSPANISRIFRGGSSEKELKTELRHGAPISVTDGDIDLAGEYGDILGNVDGKEILITLDPSSWLVSVVFFKPNTKLVRIDMTVPDCIGSIRDALGMLAESRINLISVFTKVMISYQTMGIEMVADVGDWNGSIDDLKKNLAEYLSKLNGVYQLKAVREL